MAASIHVAIEGIPGDGKTELIKMLVPSLTRRGWKVTLLEEPIQEWIDDGIFQMFLKDKARWGYTFQFEAMITKILKMRKMYDLHKGDTDIFLSERSIFSDRLFAKMLYKQGYMTEMEYKLHGRWFEEETSKLPMVPDLFFYMKTPVSTCLDRIKIRNRPGEIESYSQEYIQNLRDEHDGLYGDSYAIIAESHFVPCVPIEPKLIVDGQEVYLPDYRYDVRIQEVMTTEIEKMLKQVRRAKGFGSSDRIYCL